MSLLDRLLTRREITDDGCWLFSGARTANGYGSMRANGRTQYTHRVAYELMVGPIPADRDLDHLCRVRACFNPSHLEAVPRVTNLWRSPLTWRANSEKTHCPKRHEYSPENTYFVISKRKDGSEGRSRACITCRRERHHARKSA